MPMDFLAQNVLLVAVVVGSLAGFLWLTLVKPAGTPANPGLVTQLINHEEAMVVDVRSKEDFAKGHIQNARNMPLDTFEAQAEQLDKFRDKPVVVYCTSGMRSAKALAILKKAGYSRIYNLDGGLDAWSAAGYPLRKGKK